VSLASWVSRSFGGGVAGWWYRWVRLAWVGEVRAGLSSEIFGLEEVDTAAEAAGEVETGVVVGGEESPVDEEPPFGPPPRRHPGWPLDGDGGDPSIGYPKYLGRMQLFL